MTTKSDFELCWEDKVAAIEEELAEEIEKGEGELRKLLQEVEDAINDNTRSTATLTALQVEAQATLESAKDIVDRIEVYKKDVLSEFTHTRNGDVTNIKKFDRKPLASHSLSPLLVLLSDVFQSLRDLEDSSSSASDKWIAPDSFERSTRKYWVEDARLPELLLTCVGEAPFLVYGKTGRLSSDPDFNKMNKSNEGVWDTYSSIISSVYFDSQNFKLYNERISRREGAQLLRARWYGATRPTGKQQVFLELKTHHESWVNTKSIKERSTILEEDMTEFLYTFKVWTEDYTRCIVLKASPSLEGTKLDKAVDVLARMRSLVVKHGLRPCVRSTYKRLAFQSASTNSLRLTLDRDVTLSDESVVGQRHWSVPDKDFTKHCPRRVVPFAVFEIKLAEDQANANLDNLIDSGVLIDAAKFSKFLTAVATFNANEVATLPYWANHRAFEDFFEATAPTSESSEDSLTPIPVETTTSTSAFRRRIKESPSTRKERTKPWVAPKKAVRVEPKTYFANERTFIQWVSSALFLVTTSALLLEFEDGKGFTVEISKVMLASALAITLYAIFQYYWRIRLVSQGRPYGYVSHVGPIILASAALVCTILILFHMCKMEHPLQLNAMPFLHEKPNVCMKHSLYGYSLIEFEPSAIVVDEKRGVLLTASLSDIIAFPLPTWTPQQGLHVPFDSKPFVAASIRGGDFEALAYAGDTLFVTSEEPRGSDVSRLLALEWEEEQQDSKSDSNPRLLRSGEWFLPVPGSEGIATVKDPRSNTDFLYVSGQRGSGPFSAIMEEFEVPTVPSVDVPELVSLRVLNKNLLDSGMLEPKIGEMTFFEGILYILHDNAQVVHAWDITTGSLVARWALPMNAIGNNKQWEGLAFQRIVAPTSSGSSLRGSPATESVLLMHLAYDTPAAIWTLVVREGDTPGSVILPTCAGAPSL